MLYTVEFEEKLLCALITEPAFFERWAHVLSGEHFSKVEYKLIFNTIYELRLDNKLQEITKSDILTQLVSSRKKGLDKTLLNSIAEELNSIFKFAPLSPQACDWIGEKVENYIRTQKVKVALTNAIEVLNKGDDLTKIVESIDKAISFGYEDCIDSEFITKDFLSVYQARYNPERIVKTGYEVLDKMFLGGYIPGEVHIIVAPPKAGKSTIACNLGYNVIRLTEKPVVHITLELSELDITMKYIQRALHLTHDDILNMTEEEFAERLKPFRAKIDRNLFIKKLLPGTSTIFDVRSFIAKLRVEKGLDEIGLIIIDYDDLLAPTCGKSSMYEDAGNIYKDMLYLASYFQCPVLTLAQPNREAWIRVTKEVDKKEVRLLEAFDLAHSAQKTFYCSSVITLNPIKSNELQNEWLYVLYGSMVRRGVGGYMEVLQADLSKATFKGTGGVEKTNGLIDIEFLNPIDSNFDIL